MTICIAAICAPDGQIITVSDRMLSSQYDVVQARDDATMKAARLAPKWGVMFSGNGDLFKPFGRVVEQRLTALGADHELSTVSDICRETYWRMSEEKIVARYLYRLGFKDLLDFRQNGFSQLGSDVFGRIASEIANFELGIQFLIFGYDKRKTPHIFSLEDPGEIIDHDVERFAVIGSGTHMARGALHRKALIADVPVLIYRLLDAKFSAETATGVGKGTTALAMRDDGVIAMMPAADIRAVRAAWEEANKAPGPSRALDAIEKSYIHTAIANTDN